MNTTVSAKTGTETVLSVDYGVRLSPGEARQRIFANSTLEQPNKISVPGFEADTPVLHTVNGAEINIRKRVYYLNRNGQRVLTLRIEPTDNGSRLIGYFEKPKVSLMLVAALIVVLAGLATVLFNWDLIRDAVAAGSIASGHFNFIPLAVLAGGLATLPLNLLAARYEERGVVKWLDRLFSDVRYRADLQ